uniref:WEB family protein n=1 Tax=Kalanchoe fedtschenkoi TaxID=63787 RepID=A0A7N0T7A2_KALFE
MSETLTDTSLADEQEHCPKPTPHSSTDKCAASEERESERAEIDTSAPFESVKEAANRFGGIGFWKPRHHQAECVDEDIDVFEVEKQKAQLTDHLVEKESETLDVLKELEHTKRIAGELKSRLDKELSQHDAAFKGDAAENTCVKRLDDLRMLGGYYSGVLTVPPLSLLENGSKMETLMKLERATEEVKMTKIVMENALRRVEIATVDKLAVEEALRQRRSDHPQKRRTLPTSTKFKTVGPSEYRKEPRLRDVNGMSLVSNDSVPVLRPTLSIGQILNNKLRHLDEAEAVIGSEKRLLERNESLGQMLGRHDENSNFPVSGKVGKADDPQRKSSKFTFARFSLRLATQSGKRKTATGPRIMMCRGQARSVM